MWFYVNGSFVTESEAKISVLDRAFVYGDGCFEGLGVFGGKIPHLDEHLDRLFRSARMLRIDVPLTKSELRDVILKVASLNGMDKVESAYMRPLISRGVGPLGVKNSRRMGDATVVVIPQLSGRRAMFGDDVQVCRAVITRFSRAGAQSLNPSIKSNNYLTSILAFLESQDVDPEADVAIIHDPQGFVAEGHAMNVFCVVDGDVYTPPASVALRGITRASVIHVAEAAGIPISERQLTDYDLICADEVFVTSAMESVAAVGWINGRELPGPVPGVMTRRIRELYLQHAWETATVIAGEVGEDATYEQAAHRA